MRDLRPMTPAADLEKTPDVRPAPRTTGTCLRDRRHPERNYAFASFLYSSVVLRAALPAVHGDRSLAIWRPQQQAAAKQGASKLAHSKDVPRIPFVSRSRWSKISRHGMSRSRRLAGGGYDEIEES